MTAAAALLRELIRCPSVTPADAGAQDIVARELEEMGFTVMRLPFGEGGERVENLFARRGEGSPHFCYLGHTDVVPPGPEEKWTYPPFSGEIADGRIYGRGACDMKGGNAAFLTALRAFIGAHPDFPGSVSVLMTGDEEAKAVNGTVRVVEWMKENGHLPDAALVGEPSSPEVFGESMRIGRRGSYNAHLTVTGRQGHVAFPEKADNPIDGMLRLLSALNGHVLDQGSAHFPPSRIVITSVDVGNPAANVIPAAAAARFNIRFNDHWNFSSLDAEIRALLDSAGAAYALGAVCMAESFICTDARWPELVAGAVHDITGEKPDGSTGGGTSDARFIAPYCPVVEFGVVANSAHQIDENTDLAELELLVKIYIRVLERALL